MSLIGQSQKKVETMEAPWIEDSKDGVPSPCPTYISEKGRTLGKKKGIKWGAIGNTLGEHLGNILGTWKEHVGNKGKMKPPPPPQWDDWTYT